MIPRACYADAMARARLLMCSLAAALAGCSGSPKIERDGGLDGSELTDHVEFLDNTVDLDMSELPVPESI